MRMGSLYTLALSWTNMQTTDLFDVALVSIVNSTVRTFQSTVQNLVSSYAIPNVSRTNVNVLVNATFPYTTSQISLTGAYALLVTLRSSPSVSISRQFISRGITVTGINFSDEQRCHHQK